MHATVRKILKIPILVDALIRQENSKGCSFLIYHSIAGDLKFELNLPVSMFRRQLEFLARTGSVISYDAALHAMNSDNQVIEGANVLTFDDGYINFYTNVFPILRQLNLPAILFVTTGFVETGIPYPILHHKNTHLNPQPVTWDMLNEMAESGLVTVGAHTHTHIYFDSEPEERIIEELVKPKELFRERLGIDVQHFSYPKALWNLNSEKLVAKHYNSAVIGGGYCATPKEFNPYRIPRVPIRNSDGWLFFLAKIQGWLAKEEAMYVRLRKLQRI